MERRAYQGLLQQGDLVVARFPFSNLEDEKARPALVIAVPDGINAVLALVTSKRGKDCWAVRVADADLVQGRLQVSPSWVWTSQLFTASRKVIGSRIGRLKRARMDEIRSRIVDLATRIVF